MINVQMVREECRAGEALEVEGTGAPPDSHFITLYYNTLLWPLLFANLAISYCMF